MKIEERKDVDVTNIKPKELADIGLDKTNGADRKNQIRNPYCYQCGGYIVNIQFEDTTVTLEERLRELILKIANTEISI